MATQPPRKILGEVRVNDVQPTQGTSKPIRPSSSRIPFRPKRPQLTLCSTTAHPPSDATTQSSNEYRPSSVETAPALSDLDTEDEGSASGSSATGHPVYFGTPSRDEQDTRRMVSKQVKARRLLRRDSLELGRRNTLTLEEIQFAVREERRRRSGVGVVVDVDEDVGGSARCQALELGSDSNISADDDEDNTLQERQEEQHHTSQHSAEALDDEETLHMSIAEHVDEERVDSADDDAATEPHGDQAVEPTASTPRPDHQHEEEEDKKAADLPSDYRGDEIIQQSAESPEMTSQHSSSLDTEHEVEFLQSSPRDETALPCTELHSESNTEQAPDETLHFSICEDDDEGDETCIHAAHVNSAGDIFRAQELVDHLPLPADATLHLSFLEQHGEEGEVPSTSILAERRVLPTQASGTGMDDTFHMSMLEDYEEDYMQDDETQHARDESSSEHIPIEDSHNICSTPEGPPRSYTTSTQFDETLALDVAECAQQSSPTLPASASIPMYLDETLAFDVMENGSGGFRERPSPPSPHTNAIPQSVSCDEVVREAVVLSGLVDGREGARAVDDDAFSGTIPAEDVPDGTPTTEEANLLNGSTSTPPIKVNPQNNPVRTPPHSPSITLDSPGIGRSNHAPTHGPTAAEHFFPWSPTSPRSVRGRAAKRRGQGHNEMDSFDLRDENPRTYSPIDMSLSKDIHPPGTPLMERNANILRHPTSPHMAKLREVRDAFLLASPVRRPAARVVSPEKTVKLSPVRRVPVVGGAPPRRVASPSKGVDRGDMASPVRAAAKVERQSPVKASISSPVKSTGIKASMPSPVKSTGIKASMPSPTRAAPVLSPTKSLPIKAPLRSPTKTTAVKIAPTAVSRLPKPATGAQAPLSRIARPAVTAASTKATSRIAPPTTRLPSMHHRPTSSTSSTSSSDTRPVVRKVVAPAASKVARLPLSGTRGKTSSSGESSDSQRDSAPPSMLKRPAATFGKTITSSQRPLASPALPTTPLPPPLPMSSPMRGPNASPMKMLRRLQSSRAAPSDGAERPRARRVVPGSKEDVQEAPTTVVTSTPAVAPPTAPQPAPAPAAHMHMKPLMSMPVMPSVSRKGRRSVAATVATPAPSEGDVFTDTAVKADSNAVQESEITAKDLPTSSDIEATQATEADPPRRTSSRRAMPRSSVSIGTTSTRLRRGPAPKEVPSVPISSAALASLTTRNSRKNEALYARIDVRVVHIDGPRPPSPTAKIRRTGSSSTGGTRADRAKKRAAEIVSNEDGDVINEYEHDVQRKDHRLGAGETELYRSPVRRSKKRGKTVQWYKNLFCGPSAEEQTLHPAKPALVQKNYGLDRHGNVRSADSPPDPAWCSVVVPVSKVIYEDDDEEEEEE